MEHHDSFLRFIEELEYLRQTQKLHPHAAKSLLPDISSNGTAGNFCSGQEGPAVTVQACGGAGQATPSKEGEGRTHP
jgi:hypothetical protein